jgi:hypothetical protein
MKKVANHKVRQLLKNPDFELPNKTYKKCFCSWNICDYYTKYPGGFEEYYRGELKWWYQWGSKYNEPFPDKELCWKDYKKHYLVK